MMPRPTDELLLGNKAEKDYDRRAWHIDSLFSHLHTRAFQSERALAAAAQLLVTQESDIQGQQSQNLHGQKTPTGSPGMTGPMEPGNSSVHFPSLVLTLLLVRFLV